MFVYFCSTTQSVNSFLCTLKQAPQLCVSGVYYTFPMEIPGGPVLKQRGAVSYSSLVRAGRGLVWAAVMGHPSPRTFPSEHQRAPGPVLPCGRSCGQQGAPAPARSRCLRREGPARSRVRSRVPAGRRESPVPCPSGAEGEPSPFRSRVRSRVPAGPGWARPQSRPLATRSSATSRCSALLKCPWSGGRGKPSGCVRQCQELPRQAVGLLSPQAFPKPCAACSDLRRPQRISRRACDTGSQIPSPDRAVPPPWPSAAGPHGWSCAGRAAWKTLLWAV